MKWIENIVVLSNSTRFDTNKKKQFLKCQSKFSTFISLPNHLITKREMKKVRQILEPSSSQ